MKLRDEVDALASRMDGLAQEAVDAGARDLALELMLSARRLRDAAAGLTVHSRPRNVKDVDLPTAHRQKLSESRMPAVKGSWLDYARKATPPLPSLRAVAEALKCDPTYLSKVAKGDKKMSPRLAEAFEKLTGYPAARWSA